MQKSAGILGWTLTALLSVFVAVLASRYFSLDPDAFFIEQRNVYLANQGMLLLHVGGGTVALLVGPWQFLPWLRTGYAGCHRWMGRAYFAGVLVGGVAGMRMATMAYGGLPSQLGFGMLSVMWLASAMAGYHTVRRGDIEAHRRWMFRNFALTLAAVTLRLYLPAFNAVGYSFQESYIAVAWISWIPNLVLVEVFFQRRWIDVL